MSDISRNRITVIAIVVLILLLLPLLFLPRCGETKPLASGTTAPTPPSAPSSPSPTQGPSTTARDASEPAEVLTEATLVAPEKVVAGAAFKVTWKGPDNDGDYVTIVKPDAPADMYASFRETKDGADLELTASVEPGAYEVRYIAKRSRTVLGRVTVEITAASATINAQNEVVLGSTFPVIWTGPDNERDFITIVAAGAPDDAYASYQNTAEGSPVTLTAPITVGDAEIRYVTGEGRRVLARRSIKIIAAAVVLSAPEQAIAGSKIDVVWTGPNNSGDYITVVASGTPDGEYANYTNTSNGTPLQLLLPIMAGDAELRYMSGQGRQVLGRRAIKIVAAEVKLEAPAECVIGTEVTVTWTGPDNPGDYITIVAKGVPDGQYATYANTSSGSPLKVKAPKEAGDYEIRYAAGQGNKVLARIPLKVVP